MRGPNKRSRVPYELTSASKNAPRLREDPFSIMDVDTSSDDYGDDEDDSIAQVLDLSSGLFPRPRSGPRSSTRNETFLQQFPTGLARGLAEMFLESREDGMTFDLARALEEIIPDIPVDILDRTPLKPSTPDDLVLLRIMTIANRANNLSRMAPWNQRTQSSARSTTSLASPTTATLSRRGSCSSLRQNFRSGLHGMFSAMDMQSGAPSPPPAPTLQPPHMRSQSSNPRLLAVPTSPRRSLHRPQPSTNGSAPRFQHLLDGVNNSASITRSIIRKRRRVQSPEEETISNSTPSESAIDLSGSSSAFARLLNTSNPYASTNDELDLKAYYVLLESYRTLDPTLTQQELEYMMLQQRLQQLQQQDMLPKALPQAQSLLPPKVKIGSQWLFWLSEIYPKSFSKGKRGTLNDILRNKAPCVPAAVCAKIGGRLPIVYYVSSSNTPSVRKSRDLQLGPGRRGWPADQLPVEVFEIITDYLPRESVQTMRLVNAEFERKTSNRLFHTVVVPFRSEIYGLMIHPKDTVQRLRPTQRRKEKGKGKARVSDDSPIPEDKKVHDGMKVFQAWGDNIRRFAMAFEVDEASLESAPTKGRFEYHKEFWGDYRWPHPHYNRFEMIEDLEKKADEFKCMSQALSYLHHVKELGLSLDSGLGWLPGPDKSDRARLLQEKSEVFGRTKSVPDARRRERQENWDHLADIIGSSSPIVNSIPAHYDPYALGSLNNNGYLEAWVNVEDGPKTVKLMPSLNERCHPPLIFEGKEVSTVGAQMNEHGQAQDAQYVAVAEAMTAMGTVNDTRRNPATFKPSDLNIAQQEWLLEIEWAQRAFLSSFCMALCDNTQTFQNVHTLTISKISSRYISALQRDDVWKALPNVTNLTLKISPDWRNIVKSDTGLVTSPGIRPSSAATQFYSLLAKNISPLRNIKTLILGYVGGGEHAIGIYGRNKSILPAPLTDYTQPSYLITPPTPPVLLNLPHIETLHLENMYTTPTHLKLFARSHSTTRLRHLHLDSISLTADTEAPGAMTMVLPPLSPSDGTYAIPQAPPRHHDPVCRNLFIAAHRPWHLRDPEPNGWVTAGVRRGSWADVIDAITPGSTMNFLRYAYAYCDDAPALNPTHLEDINFKSCGYVRLTNFKDFQQAGLEAVVDALPNYLTKRGSELLGMVMRSPDELLGTIVPSFSEGDIEIYETAWPMSTGVASWKALGLEGRSWECKEDGQPMGGEGRFSGAVRKLDVPVNEKGKGRLWGSWGVGASRGERGERAVSV